VFEIKTGRFKLARKTIIVLFLTLFNVCGISRTEILDVSSVLLLPVVGCYYTDRFYFYYES
jgi:hypothetical protein